MEGTQQTYIRIGTQQRYIRIGTQQRYIRMQKLKSFYLKLYQRRHQIERNIRQKRENLIQEKYICFCLKNKIEPSLPHRKEYF